MFYSVLLEKYLVAFDLSSRHLDVCIDCVWVTPQPIGPLAYLVIHDTWGTPLIDIELFVASKIFIKIIWLGFFGTKGGFFLGERVWQCEHVVLLVDISIINEMDAGAVEDL